MLQEKTLFENLLKNSLKFNFLNFYNHKIKEDKKEYISFFPINSQQARVINIDKYNSLYVVKEKENNYFEVYFVEGMWFTKYTILNYHCFKN